VFTLANPANAQVTCSISATGNAIGAVPALPGVTTNASDLGHTEVGASGSTGIANAPGGGRVRVSCTNSGAATNPGPVFLNITFGAPITNDQTFPSTAAGIRLINSTGDFIAPGPTAPTSPNPGNIGIAGIDNAAGLIVIGLGTPGATAGSGSVGPTVPTTGIAFTAGATSTFELAGWLLSTNGKSGSINANLTSTPGIRVVTATGTCAATAGACTQVITNVKTSLQTPTVPAGTLPALVTALPNLGTTPITGGPAAVNSLGVALKSNFTIRVQENYPDLFKSGAQFNTGGVFPASGTLVQVVFSDIPPGLDISGCAAVLTDMNGATPSLPGGASVSSPAVTTSSNVLSVGFSSPVDQANVDVLWVTCTRVGLGTATLPLPTKPVTAQVLLGPTGNALSSGSVLTGIPAGAIPRYALPQPPATSLISFDGGTTPSSTAATITATAGTPQIIEVGGFFSALRVTVKDISGNPVSGATVTFTSNNTPSNAGVTFPRGNTAVSDASGQAAVDVRANFSIGSYTVTAASGTATTAVFSLANTQRLTVAVPALFSGNANQLGIAWTNTSIRTVVLRATARGYDGQLIAGSGIQNPVDLTIAAGAHIAKLGVEIFGTGIAGRAGWVELTATDTGLSGFFQLFDDALTTTDGAPFPIAPAGRLFFPHVDKDTTLYVVNTGSLALPSTAVLVYDNNGALAGSAALSLNPKAGWSGRITDLLPSLQTFDGFVVVDSQGGPFAPSSDALVGIQSYQNGDSQIVLGQPDFEFVRTGYAVHVAIGAGYTTRLTLVNPSSVQQQVQLTLNGITAQRLIPGYGRLDESLAQMFSISGSGLTAGYLKVQTPDIVGFSGYVEITAAQGLVRTTTPIARDAQSRLIFSHIAQGGPYFTGLALLNTDAATTTVSIEVYSGSGTLLASKVATLGTGERLIGPLNELFPSIQNLTDGFVRVISTLPIFGLQIIGSVGAGSGFLTNIPAGAF
jgi:hypothetical protein